MCFLVENKDSKSENQIQTKSTESVPNIIPINVKSISDKLINRLLKEKLLSCLFFQLNVYFVLSSQSQHPLCLCFVSCGLLLYWWFQLFQLQDIKGSEEINPPTGDTDPSGYLSFDATSGQTN